MMNYAFKIKVLAGEMERGVLPPVYDDDEDDDVGLYVFASGSDSDGGAPPAVTTSD
jgi:hypothetical protein